jgi:hypothetical protein
MERNLRVLPGWVQITLEKGEDPADIVPISADATLLAQVKRREGLLVVSGIDDPATAPALVDAIKAMKALGAPPPRLLALVAYMYPQFAAYHFAEGIAAAHGLQAKLFVSARDAQDWLKSRQ